MSVAASTIEPRRASNSGARDARTVETTLQGPSKDFALHTIGWQAFQDLATTIVEVALHRIVSRVAKIKDQGRDGFFRGVAEEPFASGDKRETTIQSKHFGRPTQKLTLASLAGELASVRNLVRSGRAHGYILVSNGSLTERNRISIVEALRDAGVKEPYVFGREWVVDKILEYPKVRALAPRVYGLGDLSWIKSEKARKQALAILDTMGEGLRCYVPTKAHRAAVEALRLHRLVLLLGDPAVGKSAIAAALSVAATDEKGCDVILVRNPDEFLRNWDPEIGNRLFWIDDAFGATRLDTALMEPWNKAFSALQAAMKRGNRFILTSRAHIWNQAQRELKQGAFPPLLHGHVVVDVEDLTLDEQRRILYNHLRFGKQPADFKREITPYLDEVLAAGHFRPEVARRLADPAYTRALLTNLDGLKDFFARPEAFLLDTLANLPDPMRAAIGLIFINGGRLPSPIERDEAQRLVEDLFGVNPAELRTALETLQGSFVLLLRDGERCYWTYKHPTIADAYARMISREQELVTLFVRGAKMPQVINEAICGGRSTDGIVVPPDLYPLLLDRLPRSGVTDDMMRQFLLYRSGASFLKLFLERYPEFVTRPWRGYSPLVHDSAAMMLLHAARHRCLPQEGRDRFMEVLRSHAGEHADVSFLVDDEQGFGDFLGDDERRELLDLARVDPDARFDRAIDARRKAYVTSWDPMDWFEDLRSMIGDHRTLFPDDERIATAIDRATKRLDDIVEELHDGYWTAFSERYLRRLSSGAVPGSRRRSIFEDLI